MGWSDNCWPRQPKLYPMIYFQLHRWLVNTTIFLGGHSSSEIITRDSLVMASSKSLNEIVCYLKREHTFGITYTTFTRFSFRHCIVVMICRCCCCKNVNALPGIQKNQTYTRLPWRQTFKSWLILFDFVNILYLSCCFFPSSFIH